MEMLVVSGFQRYNTLKMLKLPLISIPRTSWAGKGEIKVPIGEDTDTSAIIKRMSLMGFFEISSLPSILLESSVARDAIDKQSENEGKKAPMRYLVFVDMLNRAQ